MTEQKQSKELPTAHNAKVLECDECGDVVIPSHQLTYKEMSETSCSQCDFGKLKVQRRDMVRRQYVEQLIKDKMNEIQSGSMAANNGKAALYSLLEEVQKNEN